MSRYLATLAALLVALPAIAYAGDEAIYESLESVAIGRVFLSPAERRWLDARRSSEPAARFFPPVRPSGVPPAPAPKESKPPAGYIVSSSGQARVWRNGDFVKSKGRAATDTKFPGEIRVRRHRNDVDSTPESETSARSSQADTVDGVTDAGEVTGDAD